MSENTSPGTSPGATGGPPGNVYHKEQRNPRSQREKKPRLESGINIPGPRNQVRDNPFRVTFLASLRKFILAALVMFIFLVLAMEGLQMMDDRYGLQFLPKPEDTTPTEDDILPAQTIKRPKVAQPAQKGPVVMSATESDSAAMRRAATIARRGQDLEDAGAIDDAIAHYREALDTWPYQPQIWAKMGRLCMRKGDYDRAQIALERAALDDSTAPQVLNDIGVVYYQQGHVAEALKKFHACELNDPRSAQTYFNLSLCNLALGNLSMARANIGTYLALKPDDARALRQAAYIDAATNDFTGAMASIQKALTLAPDWPLLSLDAASISSQLGKPDDALSYLAKAEARTSPGTVLRFFAEPAFKNVNTTPAGLAYQKELIAKMGVANASATNASDLESAPAEPISSASAPR